MSVDLNIVDEMKAMRIEMNALRAENAAIKVELDHIKQRAFEDTLAIELDFRLDDHDDKFKSTGIKLAALFDVVKVDRSCSGECATRDNYSWCHRAQCRATPKEQVALYEAFDDK